MGNFFLFLENSWRCFRLFHLQILWQRPFSSSLNYSLIHFAFVNWKETFFFSRDDLSPWITPPHLPPSSAVLIHLNLIYVTPMHFYTLCYIWISISDIWHSFLQAFNLPKIGIVTLLLQFTFLGRGWWTLFLRWLRIGLYRSCLFFFLSVYSIVWRHFNHSLLVDI